MACIEDPRTQAALNEKSNTCLQLFEQSKRLFIKEASKMTSLDKSTLSEMKCLLVDSDLAIAKSALDAATSLMMKFEKPAADMLLELGYPIFPLKGAFNPPQFFPSLKFISIFIRYHPQWAVEGYISPLKKMLFSALQTNDPSFVFVALDVIDSLIAFDFEVAISQGLVDELIKLFKIEKHYASHEALEKVNASEYVWSTFFNGKKVEAGPEEKHLFRRCVNSIMRLCEVLIGNVEDPHIDLLKEVAEILGNNPLKIYCPSDCVKLLNTITSNKEMAEYVASLGAMEVVKAGLSHQNEQIRSLSLSLMKNVAFFDPQVQAYDSLIQGLVKVYDAQGDIDNKHAIPPIMALQHAGQNAEVALILLVLGASRHLLNLLKIRDEQVQMNILHTIADLGHTFIHANQIAVSGGLEAILKCSLACDSQELVQALANSFTKLLLKTTHVESIADTLLCCRYSSGKKAIVEHLVSLLGCTDAKQFKDEITFLQSIDVTKKFAPNIGKFIAKMKSKIDNLASKQSEQK